MHPIVTDRLALRPLREDDRTWFVELHADAGGSREDAERELVEGLEHEGAQGFGHFVVERLDTGERAGIVELHRAGEGIVGIEADEVEIGWVLMQEHRGSGLATEAALAVAAHALGKLGFDQLVAYVRPENEASRRVVEKLGMRRRGPGRSRSGAEVEIFELRA